MPTPLLATHPVGALLGKLFQEVTYIPFTSAATTQRARPSRDGGHIHALFKQALNVVRTISRRIGDILCFPVNAKS